MKNPPKDLELIITKKINKLLERSLGNFTDAGVPYQSICIPIAHSLEGLRCNGSEKLVNILKTLEEWNTYLNELTTFQKKLNSYLIKLQKVNFKVKKLQKQLQICPKCNGRQGTGICGSFDNKWKDCKLCNGRGIIDS